MRVSKLSYKQLLLMILFFVIVITIATYVIHNVGISTMTHTFAETDTAIYVLAAAFFGFLITRRFDDWHKRFVFAMSFPCLVVYLFYVDLAFSLGVVPVLKHVFDTPSTLMSVGLLLTSVIWIVKEK